MKYFIAKLKCWLGRHDLDFDTGVMFQNAAGRYVPYPLCRRCFHTFQVEKEHNDGE